MRLPGSQRLPTPLNGGSITTAILYCNKEIDLDRQQAIQI